MKTMTKLAELQSNGKKFNMTMTDAELAQKHVEAIENAQKLTAYISYLGFRWALGYDDPMELMWNAKDDLILWQDKERELCEETTKRQFKCKFEAPDVVKCVMSQVKKFEYYFDIVKEEPKFGKRCNMSTRELVNDYMLLIGVLSANIKEYSDVLNDQMMGYALLALYEVRRELLIREVTIGITTSKSKHEITIM